MEDKPRQYRPRIALGSGARITPRLVPDGKGGYDLPELLKKVIAADRARNRKRPDGQDDPPAEENG